MKNNASAYIDFKYGKAEVGESKFFGFPDLPEDFDWPVDEDGYDMEFICQINCEEAHGFVAELPEKGMLYFFGCIANPLGVEDAPAVTHGFQSMGNFAVRYTDIPVSELQTGEIVDENGEPAGFAEMTIELSDNEDMCTEAFHKMFGDYPVYDDELDGYELLFCLDTFSGDDFTLEFENSGYLYFLIKKDDLKNRDFDKVICYCCTD